MKDTVPKPLGKDLKYELNEYFFNNQYRFDYYRCCDKEYDYDPETEEGFYYHIFYDDIPTEEEINDYYRDHCDRNCCDPNSE